MALRRRFLSLSLAAVMAAASPLALRAAHADEGSAAQAMIQSTGGQLLGIANSTISASAKQAEVEKLVYGNVDVDSIGRWILGRYWRVATPDQRQQYMTTFRSLLVYAVLGQLNNFAGAKFHVTRAVQRDEGTVVDMIVNVPGKPETTVQWIVLPVGGRLMIADIVAAGISMRQTQRNDYAGVISQHGGDVSYLIKAMQSQLTRFQTQPAG